jgi:hypothetical protein
MAVYERVMSVNFFGPVRLCKAFIRMSPVFSTPTH